MYELQLMKNYVPALGDMDTHEITVGELLREVASLRGGAAALLEVRQDGTFDWTVNKPIDTKSEE